MQKGARRLQRKQSIDRSADFLVCHPSRRLATSISPPRKTAKYPSHRLAKSVFPKSWHCFVSPNEKKEEHLSPSRFHLLRLHFLHLAPLGDSVRSNVPYPYKISCLPPQLQNCLRFLLSDIFCCDNVLEFRIPRSLDFDVLYLFDEFLPSFILPDFVPGDLNLILL